MERMTLRMPTHIYKKLKDAQKKKPYLSLNAMINEALSKELEKKKDVEERQ